MVESHYFDLSLIVDNFIQDSGLSACAIHHGSRTSKYFYQRGIAPVRPHNIQYSDFASGRFCKMLDSRIQRERF